MWCQGGWGPFSAASPSVALLQGIIWAAPPAWPLAPKTWQGDHACLGDGGHVGVDVVQSVVHIGEGALHSLGEADVADEGTDTTSSTREGWQGKHVGSSVPMLPPSTLQIHPHRPRPAGSGAHQ